MKKTIFFLLFCFLPISVSADFLDVEIDPECLINGETRSSPGDYESDTSSWHMPAIYAGECEETPELTGVQKDAIYETFLNYFIEKNIVTSRVSQYTDGTQKEYFVMNTEGENFVYKHYFPFLKTKIDQERAKETPNYKHISIYQYAADIIGYDYMIQRGE